MILITGGLGHIGSATVQALLDLGEETMFLDWASNEADTNELLPPAGEEGVALICLMARTGEVAGGMAGARLSSHDANACSTLALGGPLGPETIAVAARLLRPSEARFRSGRDA